MTHPTTTPGELTQVDLTAVLRSDLAAIGADVDNLPPDPHELEGLIHQLKGQQRDMLCQLLSLREGNTHHAWPRWVDQAHDRAIESDAIDAGRKNLADHLDAIISEIRHAQRAHRELQGDHSSAMYDVEHAEGGRHFETALDKLAFYAEAAKALNPTRDM